MFQRLSILLSVVFAAFSIHAASFAANLINTHESGNRVPTLTIERDATLPGHRGEETTLSYRLSLYGNPGSNLPLVVQVHSWGSNFTGQEEIARWTPEAYDFIMLYFQYKPSSGNEDDWWFGTQWDGECRMWAHEAVMDIVREVVSGTIVNDHFAHTTIDPERVYMFGHSIGGTGSWQLGVRNPDVFAAIHAHAGFARFTPPVGPFQAQFEKDIVGTPEEGVILRDDGGTGRPARAYSDLSLWLSEYKGASYETPFIFATHGTGDETVPAASGGDLMQRVADEQKRGLSYLRHPGGHSEHNFIRLNWLWNFRRDRSFLAFTNRSGYGAALDANGMINDLSLFYWDPDSIVDRADRYEVTLEGAGHADVTLRRLQRFEVAPDHSFRYWFGTQNGEGTAIRSTGDGLLTIPDLSGGVRLIITPEEGTSPPVEPEKKSPEPGITLNGADGSGESPVHAQLGTPLTLSVSLECGDYRGEAGEWWLVVAGENGLHSFTPDGWVPGITRVVDMPLFTLDPVDISAPELPAGSYTFYFAVDLLLDNLVTLSSLYVDSVALALTSGDTPDIPSPPGIHTVVPDTAGAVHVWADQLQTYNDDQNRFVGQNFVGAQKLTKDRIDAIRQYNPGFMVLQYHKAYGVDIGNNIVGPTLWGPDIATMEEFASDHPEYGGLEDYYMHWTNDRDPEHRVQHYWAGNLEYHLADIGHSGFRSYLTEKMIERCREIGFNGTFFDVAYFPWYEYEPDYDTAVGFGGNGMMWYEYPPWNWPSISRDASALARNWNSLAVPYWRDIAGNYVSGETRYLTLVNCGRMITGWYEHEYLDHVDGGMSEGWMTGGDSNDRLVGADWKLSASRILRYITGNDKILIAQPNNGRFESIALREWWIANYFLLKNDKSFYYYAYSMDLNWWPEYEINIGPYLKPAPVNLDDLLVEGTDSLYARPYENGLVLVNPGERAQSYPLEGTCYRYTFSGGGYVENNVKPSMSLEHSTPVSGTLSVEPHSAMILWKPGD